MPRTFWTGLGWLGASAGGVVVGLAAGRMLPERPGATRSPRPELAEVSTSAAPRAPDPSLLLNEMASRIAALESRVGSVESAKPVAPSDSSPPPAPPTPEEARAQVAKAQADLLARMNAEGFDPRWAPGAEATFTHDLQGVGQAEAFSVRNVSCRTTMCSADLAWASGADRPTIGALVAGRYGVNCRRFGSLADPDGASVGYTAKLIFDCEGARTDPN